MSLAAIRVSVLDIESSCKKHHIRSLAFFGSVLREDFRPQSDIDFFVEFEQGHIPDWIFLPSRPS
jgi:predicted nucleotidyltransferase